MFQYPPAPHPIIRMALGSRDTHRVLYSLEASLLSVLAKHQYLDLYFLSCAHRSVILRETMGTTQAKGFMTK